MCHEYCCEEGGRPTKPGPTNRSIHPSSSKHCTDALPPVSSRLTLTNVTYSTCAFSGPTINYCWASQHSPPTKERVHLKLVGHLGTGRIKAQTEIVNCSNRKHKKEDERQHATIKQTYRKRQRWSVADRRNTGTCIYSISVNERNLPCISK